VASVPRQPVVVGDRQTQERQGVEAGGGGARRPGAPRLHGGTPNRLWLADISEHRTAEGKLYCCAIKDVFSNRIVGWAVDKRMKASLVVAAIEMAVARGGGDVAGAILHSDRGSQFRSRKVPTVIPYGGALVDDPDRIDETLFARLGPRRTQAWSTSIVDVSAGQLLYVIPGRSAAGACAWLAARDQAWLNRIEWATLDLSGPLRLAFDTVLPAATQVADPFHLVKLANTKLDECRRRVQNETLGHRGHKTDRLRAALTSLAVPPAPPFNRP